MAEIRALKDYSDNIFYPQTLTSAVYDENSRSLNSILNLKADRTDIYSKQEINDIISTLAILDIKIVTELPAAEIDPKSIYLLKADEVENNNYEEYIYINGHWEMIGTTKIDLSDYATKTDLNDYALKSSLQPIATQTIVTDVWIGTQEEYDAITIKESTKMYLIKG